MRPALKCGSGEHQASIRQAEPVHFARPCESSLGSRQHYVPSGAVQHGASTASVRSVDGIADSGALDREGGLALGQAR